MGKNVENQKEIDLLSTKVLQANFSALLYIASEQQAMIGLLLKSLVNNQIISVHQLQDITDVHGNGELLTPVYEDIYKRFAEYFLKSKIILDASSIKLSGLPERKDDDE